MISLPTLEDARNRTWTALQTPEAWSEVEISMGALRESLHDEIFANHAVVLQHTNGAAVMAQPMHGTGRYVFKTLALASPGVVLEMQDWEGDMFDYVLEKTWTTLEQRQETALFDTPVQLDPHRDVLKSWQDILRTAHPRSGILRKVQVALHALALRDQPMATGIWLPRTNGNSRSQLAFTPLDTASCHDLRLSMPAWTQDVPVHAWMRMPEPEAGVFLPMVHVPLNLDLTGHARMEILQHARQMPALDDPAFPVYWGLDPSV